ncbi:two-component sensor histidine kinase [Aeromicrobium sp. YIM 150415]|uniref:sensor histidine kinase n=1 Tax=Aeromicrobium sp. YIM 150415 TaxID=2803912 RepID=UPI001964A05A|nr:histidine kinase [Aeromicrobium sp. YIM 150415]MBM9462748.1 two-component sensor histidine kinase [Aeromicrobium sp. YIM 150415]
MPPRPAPAPLTLWGEAWRYALVIAISAVVIIAQVADPTFPLSTWSLPLDIAVGVASLVLLHWRRRFPVTIALLIALGSVFFLSLSGPSMLALVSVATRRRWREIIPVGVGMIVAGMALSIVSDMTETRAEALLDLALNTAFTALAIAWGMYVGSRRELMRTLVERAETAESEQAARVAQARTAERARIAREMHDVLAHRISMVSLHAGALAFRDDLPPADVRHSAEIIQASSHQALIELRQVLGVLRDEATDDTTERPQPAARDIPELLDEARASGMHIAERCEADLPSVPDSIGRTSYRIVQESLTNASKHAPDTTVTVTLVGVPGDALSVTVSNPLPIGSPAVSATPGAGLGLVGLAERVRLAGGTLEHSITAGQRFEVVARLPWPA